MEYFQYFIIPMCAVFGLLTPAFVFLFFRAICEGISAWRIEIADRNLKDLLTGNSKWFFTTKKGCPNKEYIELIFRHRSTDAILNIAIEKCNLEGYENL